MSLPAYVQIDCCSELVGQTISPESADHQLTLWPSHSGDEVWSSDSGLEFSKPLFCLFVCG